MSTSIIPRPSIVSKCCVHCGTDTWASPDDFMPMCASCDPCYAPVPVPAVTWRCISGYRVDKYIPIVPGTERATVCGCPAVAGIWTARLQGHLLRLGVGHYNSPCARAWRETGLGWWSKAADEWQVVVTPENVMDVLRFMDAWQVWCDPSDWTGLQRIVAGRTI